MPFSAPLIDGLATTVLIGNKPAAVAGSSGMNLPPHVGLHPSDPFMSPSNQKGIVVAGKSGLVLPGNGGRPQAHGYVLDDRTCHLPPDGWGRRAVQAAIDWEADDIAVEINYGDTTDERDTREEGPGGAGQRTDRTGALAPCGGVPRTGAAAFDMAPGNRLVSGPA